MIFDEFVDKLIQYRFIPLLYKQLVNHIIRPLEEDEDILKLLVLYSSYVTDGSACMPLDIEVLSREWKNKCEGIKILSIASNEDEAEIDVINSEINDILQYGLDVSSGIRKIYTNETIIGNLYIIENNFLFAKKYFRAKSSINKAIDRLFINYFDASNIEANVKEVWPTAANKQIDIISKGINRNLVVTGGPGTGKTTAIFYLLMYLLKAHPSYKIYLTAPSGKAASRIKESINGEITAFEKRNVANFLKEIAILKSTEEYTIHRLLQNDYQTNGFKYNENNQFPKESIFIIDESSMIDVCIFDSLLKAIPNGARVFILGDKYQLPSVECGAVLADLLAYKRLEDNKVELEVSHRFVKGSDIHDLAFRVNNGIEINDLNWRYPDDFSIVDINKSITPREEQFPVFYYDDSLSNDRLAFVNMLKEWALHFYQENYTKCSNVKLDVMELEEIYKRIDDARVLSAENEGKYGVNKINQIIRDCVISQGQRTSIIGYYPGVPIMITENNRLLDLYNGDTGILIQFEGTSDLYFLIEKASERYQVDATKVVDGVFKLGKYLLYPLRMLDLKKICYSYAITIHKSQGSGYNNILVVLPKKTGHPLLNRQILYTAITRTKGPVYIIANQESFNQAIKTVLFRYTRIFD